MSFADFYLGDNSMTIDARRLRILAVMTHGGAFPLHRSASKIIDMAQCVNSASVIFAPRIPASLEGKMRERVNSLSLVI